MLPALNWRGWVAVRWFWNSRMRAVATLRLVAVDAEAGRSHDHRAELAALEHAGAVGVLQVGRVERADGAVRADDLGVDQVVGDAAAERAGVVDDRAADGPGHGGGPLQAAEPLVGQAAGQVREVDAGRGAHQQAVAGLGLDACGRGRCSCTTTPSNPSSAISRFEPPPSTSAGTSSSRGGVQQAGERGEVGAGEEAARRAADPQRGVPAERHLLGDVDREAGEGAHRAAPTARGDGRDSSRGAGVRRSRPGGAPAT